MENDRQNQIMMLVAAGAGLLLWYFRLLEAVVFVLCCIVGVAAVLKFTTGTYSVRGAVGKAANWLGRRLAG